MNYQKLMDKNPTKLGEKLNKKGQLIEFYEHPHYGEEYPVIAVCRKLELAASTDFFETTDMLDNPDYEQYFVNGSLLCQFELEED